MWKSGKDFEIWKIFWNLEKIGSLKKIGNLERICKFGKENWNFRKNLETRKKIKFGKTLEIWEKIWKFDEKLLKFRKGFEIWKFWDWDEIDISGQCSGLSITIDIWTLN